MHPDNPFFTRRPEQLERDSTHNRRSFRILMSLALFAFVCAFLLFPGSRPAAAEDNDGLKDKVAALQAAVKQLQTTVSGIQTSGATETARAMAAEASLQARLDAETSRAQAAEAALQTKLDAETARAVAAETALVARVAAVEIKTQYVSIFGGEMYIKGTNLRIENGLPNPGFTGNLAATPTLNGLGNLIIGYNDSRSVYGEQDVRNGTHNLILGDFNNYSSYGGAVFGRENTINGPYASAIAGNGNTADGFASSITGGSFNICTNEAASISGGTHNRASGLAASVSGGGGNNALGAFASISGGIENTASGYASSVSGGGSNLANNLGTSVSGGGGVLGITADTPYGWAAGGTVTPAYHSP